MRAFVAVDLPEPVLDGLDRLQSHLRTGRIVPPENLHLTLAFLGDADPEALEELHHALGDIPRMAVTVRVAGLDLFGSAVSPRLVVAMVDETPELLELQRHVLRAARLSGLALERRRFRPHVTLARFGKTARADPRALAGFLADHAATTLPFERAHAMGLYASTLRPDGAEYEALAVYPLG